MAESTVLPTQAVARLERIQVRPDASLRDALEAIQQGGLEICLVVEPAERLAGIITDGDVRRALLRGETLHDPLESCINRDFFSVRADVGRAEVLDHMHARGFNHVPVVDAQGRLVGLHVLRELLGRHDRPNWALIMAGGKGTRLQPITQHLPKPMVTVAGRPILERLVLHLVGYGIRKVFIAVGYMSEVIEAHFGHGADFGCHIQYLREPEPLGNAGALALLPSVPEHPLLVLNGDLVTQVNVQEMLETHESRGHAATIGVSSYQVSIPFGVVELDGEGRLAGMREKPVEEFLVNAGVYVLAPEVIAGLAPGRSLSMPEVLDGCRESGRAPGVYVIREDWIDVGRHADLVRAQGRG
jgi:dTDP-glucose pyrophosphorylase/CBS domain-containing protein